MESKQTDIIRIDHLYKSYGSVHAVSDLSFRVKEGELFAFLGVNGAGKSTTISIMAGILAKDAGEVVIDGTSIDADSPHIHEEIGIVFQNSVLDTHLSVRDNLMYRGALYGLKPDELGERINELASFLSFNAYLDRPLGKLSGGQKRRIDIARALINHPRILVLDEPTTGLDPQTRRSVWSAIARLRKEEGTTVFLTTHYMEEAADADYVVILDLGVIVAEGTPLQLKNEYAGDALTLYHVSEEDVKALGYPYIVIRDAFRIAIPNTEVATKLILAHPELFKDYEITKGKMDDVFLSATGKHLSGGEADD